MQSLDYYMFGIQNVLLLRIRNVFLLQPGTWTFEVDYNNEHHDFLAVPAGTSTK